MPLSTDEPTLPQLQDARVKWLYACVRQLAHSMLEQAKRDGLIAGDDLPCAAKRVAERAAHEMRRRLVR